MQPPLLTTALSSSQYQGPGGGLGLTPTPGSSTSSSLSSPFVRGSSPCVSSPATGRPAPSSSMASRNAYNIPYNPQDWGPPGRSQAQGYAQAGSTHRAPQRNNAGWSGQSVKRQPTDFLEMNCQPNPLRHIRLLATRTDYPKSCLDIQTLALQSRRPQVTEIANMKYPFNIKGARIAQDHYLWFILLTQRLSNIHYLHLLHHKDMQLDLFPRTVLTTKECLTPARIRVMTPPTTIDCNSLSLNPHLSFLHRLFS